MFGAMTRNGNSMESEGSGSIVQYQRNSGERGFDGLMGLTGLEVPPCRRKWYTWPNVCFIWSGLPKTAESEAKWHGRETAERRLKKGV